jgi:hypothetical protein
MLFPDMGETIDQARIHRFANDTSTLGIFKNGAERSPRTTYTTDERGFCYARVRRRNWGDSNVRAGGPATKELALVQSQYRQGKAD